jgi:hypothetical protein
MTVEFTLDGVELYLGSSRRARPLPRGFSGHVAYPFRSIRRAQWRASVQVYRSGLVLGQLRDPGADRLFLGKEIAVRSKLLTSARHADREARDMDCKTIHTDRKRIRMNRKKIDMNPKNTNPDGKMIRMGRKLILLDREKIGIGSKAIHMTRKTNRAATNTDYAVIHTERDRDPYGNRRSETAATGVEQRQCKMRLPP